VNKSLACMRCAYGAPSRSLLSFLLYSSVSFSLILFPFLTLLSIRYVGVVGPEVVGALPRVREEQVVVNDCQKVVCPSCLGLYVVVVVVVVVVVCTSNIAVSNSMCCLSVAFSSVVHICSACRYYCLLSLWLGKTTGACAMFILLTSFSHLTSLSLQISHNTSLISYFTFIRYMFNRDLLLGAVVPAFIGILNPSSPSPTHSQVTVVCCCCSLRDACLHA